MTNRISTVSSGTALISALRSARPGDTILLASGNYGNVSLSGMNFAGQVIVRSANPDADAVFTTLRLTNVNNLVIDDIDIRRPLSTGTGLNTGALTVNKSSNVSIVNSDIQGSLNGNAWDDGHGIVVTDSSRVSILNSNFRQLDAATIFSRSNDVIFAGNSITETREGVNISQTRSGLFDRNHVTDMQPHYAAGDHPDAFQVHSGGSNNTASSDLKFTNNIMIQGSAGPVGGIFIRSEAVASGVRHSNIVIENNYYEGAYRHAFSVSNSDTVRVENNTVLMGDYKGIVPAIQLGDVRGGQIIDNVATLILEHRIQTNQNMQFANNVDVWDSQFRTGIAVSSLFENRGAGEIDFSRLGVLSGSAAANAGAGFRAIADVGQLSGGTASQLASYLPQFEGNFTAFA
ncbi:MAG: hypothetical protein RL490_1510 [Pseudomonadota bacterium]|jgi:hypothetical protein